MGTDDKKCLLVAESLDQKKLAKPNSSEKWAYCICKSSDQSQPVQCVLTDLMPAFSLSILFSTGLLLKVLNSEDCVEKG